MRNYILMTLIICQSFIFASGDKPLSDDKSTLPYSKQATIIDTASSAEIVLESTGIYYSTYKSKKARKKDITKHGIQEASIDAKKAAIYSLLFMGTDPILSSPQERQRFMNIEEDLFTIENVETYITYEDKLPMKKVILPDYEGLRIVKQIKVNRELLIRDLEESNIVTSRQEITAILGTPFIMVLPVVSSDKDAVTQLSSDPVLKHTAGVIQSALTAKQYDVLLPDQQQTVSALSNDYFKLSNVDTDPVYQLALSLGSDIYLDFSVSSANTEFDTQKYATTLRAFETSTGRLLGSETGYSKSRRGDDYVSIEESTLDAITNVLSRVSNYWKTDILRGTQYKVIVSLSNLKLNDYALESVQNNIIDAIDSVSNISKEIAVTPRTIDYIVWVKPKETNSARKVYQAIKSAYEKKTSTGKLKLLNQNRKLVQLTIEQ